MTKKILHIFPDDKFFDSQSIIFDLIEDVENIYLYYTPCKEYKFKYIKLVNKLTIVNKKKDYHRYFSDPSIDIIYFHSLNPLYYSLFKHIDTKKVVAWWSWGYDVYGLIFGLKPLLDINLYKPLTQEFLRKRDRLNLKLKAKNILLYVLKPYLKNLQSKVISRIDYCKTVLPIEYDLLRKNEFFKARIFFYKFDSNKCFNQKHISSGNILLGNSATPTNNHLDILDSLSKIKIKANEIIIPLNYPTNEIKYKTSIKNTLKKQPHKVHILENFMTRDDYNNLLDSCTHAIFGHLRQQAVGNVNISLQKGMKIFLYKDSIVYKQLKKAGYYIYTIDLDLNEIELNTLLPEEYAIHNRSLYQTISADQAIIAKELRSTILNMSRS